jgi:hypothetical protein
MRHGVRAFADVPMDGHGAHDEEEGPGGWDPSVESDRHKSVNVWTGLITALGAYYSHGLQHAGSRANEILVSPTLQKPRRGPGQRGR